jgi:hypothetical protein
VWFNGLNFELGTCLSTGQLTIRNTGRLAARLLADDPDIKPRHFGDVMSTEKLLSLNVYFQIEMENYHNRTEYATNGLSCIANNVV